MMANDNYEDWSDLSVAAKRTLLRAADLRLMIHFWRIALRAGDQGLLDAIGPPMHHLLFHRMNFLRIPGNGYDDDAARKYRLALHFTEREFEAIFLAFGVLP